MCFDMYSFSSREISCGGYVHELDVQKHSRVEACIFFIIFLKFDLKTSKCNLKKKKRSGISHYILRDFSSTFCVFFFSYFLLIMLLFFFFFKNL